MNATKAAESSAANASASAVVELEPSASAATATAAVRAPPQQQQQPSAAAAASMNSALSASDAEILRDPTKFADELKSLMSELGASGSGLPAEDAEPSALGIVEARVFSKWAPWIVQPNDFIFSLSLFFLVSFSTFPLLWPVMKTLQQLIQGLQNLPDGAGPDFAAFAAAAAAAENKASSSSSSSTLPATAAASAAKSSSSASAAATPAVSLEQSLEQMMQAVSQGAKSAGAAVRLDTVC